MVAWDWEWEKEWTTNGPKMSFRGDRNVLKLDCDGDQTLKFTESH